MSEFTNGPSPSSGLVQSVGAEEPFIFPWPGPGNSEGPVDPDPSPALLARGSTDDQLPAVVGKEAPMGPKR